MIGSVVGSIIGVPLAIRSGEGMRTALPFGVFLGIGFLAVLFFGHEMADWYLRFVPR